MHLINLDNLVLIGPGSEWLWTMVSGIVVAVTLVGLYFQLRMQRSQAAIEQLERVEQEYASERFARIGLEVLRAMRAGVAPADLPPRVFIPILNFWERVGSLARRGHLDLDLLWDGGTAFYCQSDWVRFAPAILKARADTQNPKIAEHFEWLAGVMEAKGRHLGVQLDDEAKQAARLGLAIAAHETDIRLEEELRAVIVRPMSTETITPDIGSTP